MQIVPANVLLLHCGDAQYPQDELGRVIDTVRQGVEALPSAKIVYSCKIMNDCDADEAAAHAAELRFDAIIVHMVSWHITPFVMRTLKDYRQTPVLVWGTGGWTDQTGKLISPASAAATTALVRRAKVLDPALDSGRAIFAAAEAGDAAVLSLLDAWEEEIAQGLAGLVHIFNPQLILIGGGVSAQQKLLIEPVAAKVRASVMPAFRVGLEIRAAALQNDAGLVGAVQYFRRHAE